MSLDVHARFVFEHPFSKTTEAKIEACIRGMKTGQKCQLLYSDATLTITKSSLFECDTSLPDSRITPLFKKINANSFRRPFQVILNCKWDLWDGEKALTPTTKITELLVKECEKPFIWQDPARTGRVSI